MKIEIWRGCTSDGTIIDGKHEEDLNEQEYEAVVDYILQKAKKAIIEDHTVQLDNLIEIFQESDYKDHGTCGQCNDMIFSTYFEI